MPIFDYAGTRVEFVGDYDGVYGCINEGRFYERPFLESVRELDLHGTYLDIGTNIGNHALFFSMFCPSDAVIGFEPVAPWRIRATANIAANGQDRKVQLLPLGLSDRREHMVFKPHATTYQLECVTLDQALPDVSGVAFVKMDIEGSEPKALIGGRDFFRRNRPLIAAEVLGSTDELAAAAATVGYRLTGRKFPSSRSSPMFELAPE